MTRLYNALVAAAFNSIGNGFYYPIFALLNYLFRLVYGAAPALWADVVNTANLAGTYANGTAGVGATLTKSSAGALGTIDGVTPTLGMFVLLTAQTTAAQNGLYTVTNLGSASAAWVLTRWGGWDQSAEMKNGSGFYVRQGTTYGGTTWAYTGASSPTVGTTSLVIAQDSVAHTAQPAGSGIPFTYPIILSAAVSGVAYARINPGFACKISKLDADVVAAPTTTGKGITLQLQISGQNVSGGALAVTSTSLATLGARVSATTVVGSNVVGASQEISLAVDTVAAQFAEGEILAMIFLDKQ